MTNARIERLTREALGPARRKTYTKVDDTVLRAIGIVILVVTVVAFASWPRDDVPPATHAASTKSSASAAGSAIVPVVHSAAEARAPIRVADHTPIY